MLDQTQIDSLTGCFVREALNPFLERIISESNLKAEGFSIALIDLDRFKKFNDKFGHTFGDEILKYATSTLRLTFSEQQSNFFRYGGDEFIGVFLDKGPEEILRLVRKCNYNLIHRPFLFKDKFYRITFSCGIVSFPSDGKTTEELIKKADEAMYLSKHYGRNRVTLAGRIKYLKLLRVVILTGTIGTIFLSLFIAYKLTFRRIIQPTVNQIKDIKIITKPGTLDAIILKSGMVFEGHILAETKDKVVLRLYLDRGEGSMTFDKPEIAQIKYGSSTPPKEDYNAPTK